MFLFFGLVISVRSDWEMGRAALQIIGTSTWKGMFGSHGQVTVNLECSRFVRGFCILILKSQHLRDFSLQKKKSLEVILMK